MDQTEYSIEDGFAHPAQTWHQNDTGDFLVENTQFDLRGLPKRNTHPKNVGDTFTSTLPLTYGSSFGKFYYDAMGVLREEVKDAQVDTGSQLVYFDSPRVELRQDEEGYQTQITYDGRHRIKQVEQGKEGNLKTIAQYRYDPLGKLVRFKDGEGAIYTYSYDGGGRLREVKYGVGAGGSGASSSGPTGTPDSNNTMDTGAGQLTRWYTYDYNGRFITNRSDNTGGKVDYEYDDIGRIEKKTVTEGLASSTGPLVYTNTYDKPWQGKIAVTIDPVGETLYKYDSLGRVTKLKRTFSQGSSTAVKTADFEYTYDLQGNVLTTTYPSGHITTSTYDYGFLTKETGTTSGATDYTLSYDYNKWRLWNKVSAAMGETGGSSLPMVKSADLKFNRSFLTPLWPDEVAIETGGTKYSQSYSWKGNGLLSTRTDGEEEVSLSTDSTGGMKPSTTINTIDTVLTPSISSTLAPTSGVPSLTAGEATIHYDYDDLRQLTSLQSVLQTLESYAYDSAGNLTSMQDSSGETWTYKSPGALNMISGRTSDKGGSESYEYDDAGRLTEAKSSSSSSGTQTYVYDGLGRLRGVQKDGIWKSVLDYDADSNLLRIADGDPFTASPNYTYIFGDWRYKTESGDVIEKDNAFVAATNGTRSWLFREYDGHVAMTFDDNGAEKSSRKLGAYGTTIDSSGTPWDIETFHSAEAQDDLFFMGQRHLMKDGMWLQPEPLLYGSGIPQKNRFSPLTLASHRYSANSPTLWQDLTGRDSDLIQEFQLFYAVAAAFPCDGIEASNFIGFNEGDAILLHQIPGTHSITITNDRTLVRLEENGTQFTYYQNNDGSIGVTITGSDTDARIATDNTISDSYTASETGVDAPGLTLADLQVEASTDLEDSPVSSGEISGNKAEKEQELADQIANFDDLVFSSDSL